MINQTSANGRKLIESFEGCFLQAYDDYNDHVVHQGDTVHGTLTIGYGHTSAAGEPSVYIGQNFTREEADQTLSSDLRKVETQVTNLVKVSLNQNQFDALVSFQFNTGALEHSSILTLLNQGDYKTASEHLLLYDKEHVRDKLITVPGLLRRREAEQKLFLT